MQIIVTGRKLTVTNAIQSQITTAVEGLFAHYPTLKVSSVRVVMAIGKNDLAEIEVNAALKQHELHASGADLDLNKAIALTMEKLGAQVDRYADRYKRPLATPPHRDLTVPPEAEKA